MGLVVDMGLFVDGVGVLHESTVTAKRLIGYVGLVCSGFRMVSELVKVFGSLGPMDTFWFRKWVLFWPHYSAAMSFDMIGNRGGRHSYWSTYGSMRWKQYMRLLIDT